MIATDEIITRLDRLESMISQLLVPQARLLGQQQAGMTPEQRRAMNKAVIKAAKEKRR